ncbi:MAG: glyoxylate/hydroxypyruvate reductase A [Casimicrobiaceae bacterium]
MSVLLLTQPQPPAMFAGVLRELLPEVPVWEHADDVDPDAVEAILAWQLKGGILDRYPNLRLLCATAAGVEKITGVPDLRADVQVMRTVDPSVNTGLAQYVLLMALRQVRGMQRFEAQQRAHDWTRQRPPDPFTVTAGVLGMGEVGRTVAKALQVAGFNVCGWSRTPKHMPGVSMSHGHDGLQTCLRQSHYLVCTLPLTAQTLGILDRNTLALLPRGAYVINVARGGHLVEPDLIALLDSGHLAGAALDVQQIEPLPAESPLWDHPAITITPHIAAQASVASVATQFAENWKRLRASLPLVNVIDRDRGY